MMAMLSIDQVECRVLVMEDNDVLVRVLQLQLSDHALGKFVLCSFNVVQCKVNQAFDKLCAGLYDHCGERQLCPQLL